MNGLNLKITELKLKRIYFGIIYIVFFVCGSHYIKAAIPSSELDALIALYNSTDGANWSFNENWLDTEVSVEDWAGISLTSDGNSVEEINLNSMNLSGNIPPELVNLSNLEVLDLWDNDLNGSIPSELGNLSNLEVLDLGGNDLNGTIPSELGNLSNLEILSLTTNDLNGSIPSELGNLSNLKKMRLYSNELNGSIPSELGNLSNLDTLELYFNDLNGNIPSELGNLSNLVLLNLGYNDLNGTIPSELGNLSNLEILDLNSNDLNGNIPPELGNLSNLEILDLGPNDLNGSIPSELGNLSNLEVLDLYFNDLNGSIPSELGNLSNLKKMDLALNDLNGNIPSELGNLSNLQRLFLSNNAISGNIPLTIGNLSNLLFLRLDNNALSGDIPLTIGNLSNLLSLHLNGNVLSGDIPITIGNLLYLYELYIYDNAFNFTDLESFVSSLTILYSFEYFPQAPINLVQVGTSLSASEAGGTLSNNTYSWYKDGSLVSTTTGNDNYEVTETGIYFCEVSNSIVTNPSDLLQNLVLSSESLYVEVGENLCLNEVVSGDVRYVNGNATGGNTGLDWENAYLDLESALADARLNSFIGEVWIASGNYYPSVVFDLDNDSNLEAREACFMLVNGLDLYGGFAGDEIKRCQRNLNLYQTVLSGDIDQNDLNNPAESTTDIQGANAYHVVVGDDISEQTILDGITISNGKADGTSVYNKRGGALIINSSLSLGYDLIFSNSTIVGNYSNQIGGALYVKFNEGGNLKFENCILKKNRSLSYGGSASIWGVSQEVNIDFQNCEFSENDADLGGALHFNFYGGISVTNKILNCIFWRNEALVSSAGAISTNVFSSSSHDFSIINSSFVNNSCNDADEGGVIRQQINDDSTTSLGVYNSLFWGNTADGNPNVIINEDLGSLATLTTDYYHCSFDLASCPTNGTGGTSQCTNCLFNEDPFLEDASIGNLQFMYNSALVDAGDSSQLPSDNCDLDNDGDTSEQVSQDLSGQPRVLGTNVDIGAYEGASNLLKVKLFLEGSYNLGTGEMNTNLNSELPKNQPFNRGPWNYTGTESLTTVPSNAVDWLLMELLNSNDDEVERVAVLLLSDGTIMGVNQRVGIPFTSDLLSSGENYQLIIRSRNHLAVLGPSIENGTTFPNSSTTIIDFSDSLVVPLGSSQLKDLEGNGTIWGLFAGDINSDGIISVSDFNSYRDAFEAGTVINVYEDGDCSNNKNVTVEDFNLYKSNSSKIGVWQVRYE